MLFEHSATRMSPVFKQTLEKTVKVCIIGLNPEHAHAPRF